MTGPEHFREAERLAEAALNGDGWDEPERHRLALVAQVHATLAHAAAVIDAADHVRPFDRRDKWAEVAS